MKTISPIQSWINGKSVTATIFNMYVIGGVLGSSASFYYSLLDSDLANVAQGNLTMSGEAYLGWGNDDEYAWDYAAKELNLIIIGEGEKSNYYKKLILANNLEKRIYVFGYKKNIFNYMNKASCFVSTSLWDDPGFVIVEAAVSDVGHNSIGDIDIDQTIILKTSPVT